jgi:hypothetical protein
MKKILSIEGIPYIVCCSNEEFEDFIKKSFETKMVDIKIFDTNTLTYKQIIDVIDEAEYNMKNFPVKHRKHRKNKYKDKQGV